MNIANRIAFIITRSSISDLHSTGKVGMIRGGIALLLLLLLQSHDILWNSWRGPLARDFDAVREEFDCSVPDMISDVIKNTMRSLSSF